MNHRDLVDGFVETTDDFCGTVLENGSKVVSTISIVGGRRFYILKCDRCALDPELYGEGYFKSDKSSIIRGRIPCGCSPSPRLNPDQLKTLITRKLKDGIEFVGLGTKFSGVSTKIILSCQHHGIWETPASTVLHKNGGCFSCSMSQNHKNRRKSEEEQTKLFMSTGKFAHGTTFKEMHKKQTTDQTVYYSVVCGKCHINYESRVTHLKNGHRGCLCSTGGQLYAYILDIAEKSSGKVLAIKFGITRRKVSHRIWDINKNQNQFKASLVEVWKFNTTKDCRNAELACSQKLENGVIPKGQIEGFSETTSIENIDTIRQIYRENGGFVLSSAADSNSKQVELLHRQNVLIEKLNRSLEAHNYNQFPNE